MTNRDGVYYLGGIWVMLLITAYDMMLDRVPLMGIPQLILTLLCLFLFAVSHYAFYRIAGIVSKKEVNNGHGAESVQE